MTELDTSYYRARMDAIMELIKAIPLSDEKNNDRVLLRNGFIPEKLLPDFGKILHKHQQAYSQANGQKPFSFVEKCSFNTWFAIHPEKVAGVEYVTTSREFPIMVKGTKDDIIEAISRGVGDNKDNKVRIAKAQSVAKLKLLELIKI